VKIAISLALLILGAAGTLAAFGGKTWLDDGRPLVRRITRRGWIALTCLTLATCAGIVKAVLDNESSRTAALAAASDRANLAAQRGEIAKQSQDLANARASLERQSVANLVTILAGTHRIVGQKLDLRLPGMPGLSATIGEVLFPDLPRDYRDLAEIDISLHSPGAESVLHVAYGADYTEAPPDLDGVTADLTPSQAGVMFLQYAESPTGPPVDAARGYNEWAGHMLVLQVGLTLVKRAATAAEIEAFDRRHPELSGELSAVPAGFAKTYDISDPLFREIAASARRRFSHAVGSLVLRLAGGQDSPVAIVSDLDCGESWRFHRKILFLCRTRGTPRMEVDQN
jgi:hypothetical protein